MNSTNRHKQTCRHSWFSQNKNQLPVVWHLGQVPSPAGKGNQHLHTVWKCWFPFLAGPLTGLLTHTPTLYIVPCIMIIGPYWERKHLRKEWVWLETKVSNRNILNLTDRRMLFSWETGRLTIRGLKHEWINQVSWEQLSSLSLHLHSASSSSHHVVEKQ